MRSKEEQETYWQKHKEIWLAKELKFQSEHELVSLAAIWPYTQCPEEATQELANWLGRLTTSQKHELASLVSQKGTYSEDQVLADWVLEHAGRLWFRHALYPKKEWKKRVS